MAPLGQLFVLLTCGFLAQALALTVNVCADDNQYIYADGTLIGSFTDTTRWNVDVQATIPVGTRILGVKVVNVGGPCGWKAFFSDGSVSDTTSWKCSAAVQTDNSWALPSYDDSKWTAPIAHPSPATFVCSGASYPASAQWLWTDSTFYSDPNVIIYCRKTLQLTFNTCADENQWVYADGTLVASYTVPQGWGQDITATIPASTSIVGVKVLNSAGPGGWKGYFSDGRLTDAYSWKCTNVTQSDNNWLLSTYDDSKWVYPAAQINTAACGSYPQYAMWLWPDSTFSTPHTPIYCRSKLGKLTINTCADDNQYIYADGTLIGSITDKTRWGVDLRVGIPEGTRVIGVRIFNTGGAGGWKGYFSDGRVTDAASWKCTATAQADNSWTLSTFDDSKWTAPSATTYTSACVAGYPASAMWLWTDSSYYSTEANTNIYCRMVLINQPCAKSPCQNGGSCLPSGSSYTCTCAIGFTGTNCGTSVPDPCRTNPCSNGGSCVRLDNTNYSCQCASFYSGPTCQTATPCASSPCQNGGTCINVGTNDYDCNCPDDYNDGDTCSTYQDPCVSSPCQNGGRCTRLSYILYSCTCASPWIGNYCELRQGLKPCNNSPCLHGGSCTNIDDTTYLCVCVKQWEGPNCNTVHCLADPSGCPALPYGRYAYCDSCNQFVACRKKKQVVRTCSVSPYYNRALRKCAGDSVTACTGL